VNEYTASNGYRIVSVSDTEPVSWLKILNKNPDPEVNERHSLGLYSIEALREFFKAEANMPTPAWHDAKPGEVWVIDHDFERSVVCKVVADSRDYAGGFGFVPILTETSDIGTRASAIRAARRIYPEGEQ
jgi:hypothetical protein